MKSAAFREGYKVSFCHCIVLTLTLKTQFHWKTNKKLQRTKTAERNALLIKVQQGAVSNHPGNVTLFNSTQKLQATMTSNKSHQQ